MPCTVLLLLFCCFFFVIYFRIPSLDRNHRPAGFFYDRDDLYLFTETRWDMMVYATMQTYLSC